MRDPNRLFKFYIEFAKIHARAFPDWREGQLWHNFLKWCESIKGVDPFFSESDELLQLFVEFAECIGRK